MPSQLPQRRADVLRAAQRFDASLETLGAQTRALRGAARALSPPLLIGAGLAAGFLLVVLPRRLRGTLFVSLGQFVIARLLKAWRPGGGT